MTSNKTEASAEAVEKRIREIHEQATSALIALEKRQKDLLHALEARVASAGKADIEKALNDMN